MAYIPTIRTFEDDVNDHRGFDEAPISDGIEKINKKDNILVPEKKEANLTKKILTFIAVLFIAASLALLGYYFYNMYLERQEEARLISEANQRQEEELRQQNIESDLAKILPKLAPGIAPYTQSVSQRNNIIILNIKTTDLSGIDNYSALFAYILAHKKDLSSDLFYAFKIQNLPPSLENFENTFGASTTSTSSNKNSNISTLIDPRPMSSEDVVWEIKTLNNQDFEAANAGLTTIIYGYVDKRYLIMTTSLNDFLETARSIQTSIQTN